MCPTCGAISCEHLLFTVKSRGASIPVYCAAGRERGRALLADVLVRMVSERSKSDEIRSDRSDTSI
jgi:hypothetical protein